MRFVPVPTARLTIAATAASVAVLLLPFEPPASLIVVNAALLTLGLVDFAFAPAPGRVGVEREAPGVIALGGEAQLTWRLQNPTDRAVTVAIADELRPSLRATTRRVRMRVPARSRASATADLRPTRRGRFDPAELAVRVEGPLGLAARQATRRQPSRLRVYPAFRSRDEAELRIDRARILEVGLRSAQGRGGGTEFETLREYSEDDEFRRMDWAATARTGKPIVRTYRAERNQNVLVLLDNGRLMAGLVEGVARVEHAMDAVMTLITVATRLGDRAGLIAFDREVRTVVPPGRSRGQLGRVTEAMYELQPALVESDYRAVFTAALTRFRRRALVVVLTELADDVVAETLIPALPMLAKTNLVVIGTVRDPDVVRWAHAAPADGTGVYRKAAAVAALDRRSLAVARLRGLGATVVDAAPGTLAPQLADAYLRVKATGRL